jgi:hypothetical protein
MFTRQTVARRSASKQAAQARRLLAASTGPAKYIIDSTIADDRFTGRTEVFCRAHTDQRIGCLYIPAGRTFYLLKSRICDRYFAVVRIGDQWYTSTTDKRTADGLITRAKKFREQRNAALKATA